MLLVGSVLDTRTEFVKDTLVSSVVELISGMLVSTAVTVMAVSDRRVLLSSAPLCVPVLAEFDVFIEAETVLFSVVSGIKVDNVVLDKTDSDVWGAELAASLMVTAFCEFLVPFRVVKCEGTLLLQGKAEVVHVAVLVSNVLVLVLGVAVSTEATDPVELCGS